MNKYSEVMKKTPRRRMMVTSSVNDLFMDQLGKKGEG
jgi:hypothetical protein